VSNKINIHEYFQMILHDKPADTRGKAVNPVSMYYFKKDNTNLGKDMKKC
jgi:hypothetical protein